MREKLSAILSSVLLLLLGPMSAQTQSPQFPQNQNKQNDFISILSIQFWARNVDEDFLDATDETDAVQLQIWQGENVEGSGDIVHSRGYWEDIEQFPENDGLPVLFRLTAPELERPIMSYTAWNYMAEFTYPASGTKSSSTVFEYIYYPCPEEATVFITATNTVLDSIDSPSLYSDTFLHNEPMVCEYGFEVLENNILYPRDDYSVTYSKPQGVLVEIGPTPLFGTISVPHYFFLQGQFPGGPLRGYFDLPGYRSIPSSFDADPCDQVLCEFLAEPISHSELSPVDEFPRHSGPVYEPFPFPPPATYIQKAREQLILGQSTIFGYLERALNPEWDLTFGATTPYMGGVKDFVEKDVVYTLDAPEWIERGETAEVVLSATGDLANLKAMNATLVFEGITSGTETLVPIEVLPGEDFTSATFASHQQPLLNGDLEVRAYAFQGSAGVPPASSRESSTLTRSRAPTATSAGETPAIPLLRFHLAIPEDFPAGSRISVRLRTELDGDTALTSLADTSGRLFTALGSSPGTFQPHAGTETEIRVSSGPATTTGWVAR